MYKSVKKTLDIQDKHNGYRVITNSDVVQFVPLKEDNTDYQNILEWEKIDGNTIEEAD
jgi:glutamate formiminotransferase